MSDVDWQSVEAVRRDWSAEHVETVAHALLPDADAAVCGAVVRRVQPATAFMDQFLFERWGPIRRCTVCATRFAVPVDENS